MSRERFVRRTVLDGVELLCPKNDEAEIQRVKAIAEQYDLLTTAGTDFHGMYSSRNHHVGMFTMPIEWLDRLKVRASEKTPQ